jgi:hypothetical protein
VSDKPLTDAELASLAGDGPPGDDFCNALYDDSEDSPALALARRAAAEIRRLRAGRAPLFRLGDFTLHSGANASWKIDCDALTDADLACLAKMAAELLPPFGSVEGVPTGGLRFAAALRPYATFGPPLVADDVLTTGNSMEAQRRGRPDALGVVIFARGPCPPWVTPLFAAALKKEPRP